MKTWFIKHRGKIITHGAIITAFIIFLLFGAEPLFNHFNELPGQAKLQNITLPPETNDLKYAIDHIYLHENTIEIGGWAFIDGQDTKDNKIYIVLKSDSDTLVYDTLTKKRVDVTKAFVGLNLNLDDSGFLSIIPRDKIIRNGYLIGIYIRKGNLESFGYTDKMLIKTKSDMQVTLKTSRLINDIILPEETGDIKFYIDRSQIIKDESGKEFLEIVGWAFIEGTDTQDLKKYLVLKSPSETYIFETFSQKRPDVTAAFKDSGLNLDNSGFIARIEKTEIKPDNYQAGIFIMKRNIKILKYTNVNVDQK